MSEFDVVQLSRLQFALTAMYHFLFVPLTLGLSLIIRARDLAFGGLGLWLAGVFSPKLKLFKLEGEH